METYMRIIDGMSAYLTLCERGDAEFDEDILAEFLNAIYLLRKDPKNGV